MTTPTAKELEGLVSMHQDLRYVMMLTHASIELIKKNKDGDHLLLNTYWSAALNAYARPFKDGVRQQRLNKNIFADFDGGQQTHQYFLDQRDKLIAHSVNPFENVIVGVIVDPAGKVIGAGELAGRLIATSEHGLHELNQLAKIGTEHLMSKIEERREALVKEASRMSPKELAKLDNAQFIAPGPDQASKSR